METDGATGILIVPDWPTQAWYSMLKAPDDIAATQDEMTGQSGDTTTQGRPTSTQVEAPVDGLSLVRQSLLNTGLLVENINIVLASWKDSTKIKHFVCVHKWIFCTRNHINMFSDIYRSVRGTPFNCKIYESDFTKPTYFAQASLHLENEGYVLICLDSNRLLNIYHFLI